MDTTFQRHAVRAKGSRFLPPPGLFTQHLGKLFANSLSLRHDQGRLPTNLTFCPGALFILPVLSVLGSSRLNLPKDHAQGFFKCPAFPIPPATGPVGQTMGKLHNETGGALRIRGLWELLPGGNSVREAIDTDVHSTLARVEGRPCLPHLIPSPYRLSREAL
ncbi:hypothetical protein U9R90_07895 [Streptomyces sp. E11-3]|uniref:hypothetical protein n=1 Tax=Streptomyces sp. E11-3 TaxID=3110112 RepID=UPI00397F2552